jgi:hypothetical protein
VGFEGNGGIIMAATPGLLAAVAIFFGPCGGYDLDMAIPGHLGWAIWAGPKHDQNGPA